MAFTVESLEAYSELVIRVGLNLRAGQRLLIIGPLANGGASLEAAPLVRRIAVSAYRAGAPIVEVLWGDEELLLLRFQHAPRESFGQFSAWLPRTLLEHVEHDHAVLSVYANDPDHLKDQNPELITQVQQATSRAVREFREQISRNQINWTVVAAAGARWAAKVFPDAPDGRQVDLLWDAIGRMCRLDRSDPIAAWETHLAELAARRDFLNAKRYTALNYQGPGTSLSIGLPDGHAWVAGRSFSQSGIEFAPNLPTEEVFTIAHRNNVQGTVHSTKPLSYGGTLIEDFTLRFENGRVVNSTAARGDAVLRRLIDTDDGAGRLGEVALVPNSSPISQTGRLFYNTLFDENAASHVALGSAYKFTLDGGEAMDDETFARAGGNRSAVHVDFMIGSGELDIDGVRPEGTAEPLMRRGEWTS
jgi:aminopeptidase